MKHVYLIRHGKSSWKDESLSDEERPLKRRGEQDAKLMAKILKNRGVMPELIVSSPAKRALRTAQIFAERLDYDEKKIVVNKLLYFEGIDNIIKTIQQLDDKLSTVFMFGHNPDFTELANRFSKETIDNVPTCGVIGIEFDVASWKKTAFGNGKMIFYDYPSNYR